MHPKRGSRRGLGHLPPHWNGGERSSWGKPSMSSHCLPLFMPRQEHSHSVIPRVTQGQAQEPPLSLSPPERKTTIRHIRHGKREWCTLLSCQSSPLLHFRTSWNTPRGKPESRDPGTHRNDEELEVQRNQGANIRREPAQPTHGRGCAQRKGSE